ncbi:MAG: rhamnulokinase [Eubacteriales bacterium]|nr:rhamnulokinase [Eubacteriales bacterium]MDD4327733.1 rhamnulokinase [Eubacteriales bacterium]MDD4716921.1 rhamnulokinase [Eubacteriales bacterium]
MGFKGTSERILLGFDYGASSGRAMVAVWKDGKLILDEVHRFANEPVMTEKCFYWDTLRLYHELKEGIRKAVRKYGRIDSIGIDTWGVDYALISKQGTLLTNPIHYRDARTDRSIPEVRKIIPFVEMYKRTGLAHQTFNTVYQLYAEKMDRPELYACADKILYTPDFFAYLLTGRMFNEYTMATTGGLINADTAEYDEQIIGSLGLDKDKFPDIIKPGNVIGDLTPFVCTELGIESVPVIAVCTHDTASAAAAIPIDRNVSSAYLISGTWSLLGIESDKAICSDEAREEGFTNEGGAFGKFVFLKNINGLWLMQSLRREWGNRFEKLSYDEIESAARTSMAEGKRFIVNPNEPGFTNPVSMIDEIRNACSAEGQGCPDGVGEIALAIYNGLVREYVNSVKGLEKVTGQKIGQLNMVGGGIQDKFLSELTCEALGIPVLAGPVEASVIGNFLLQLKGLGDIDSIDEGRDIVRNSFDIGYFTN